jgi:hypothetical protein
MSETNEKVVQGSKPADYVLDSVDKIGEYLKPENWKIADGTLVTIDKKKKLKMQFPTSKTMFGYDNGSEKKLANGKILKKRRHSLDYVLDDSTPHLITVKNIMDDAVKKGILGLIAHFGHECFGVNTKVDLSDPDIAKDYLGKSTPVSHDDKYDNSTMRFYPVVNSSGQIFTQFFMSEGGDKIDPTRMCIPGTTFIPIAGIERFTIYEKMLHINWTLSECAIVHVPDPSEVEAQEKSSAPYTRINLNADTAHLGNDTKKNLGVCVWTSDGEEVIEDDNNKKVDSKEPIDEMRKSKRGRVVA